MRERFLSGLARDRIPPLCRVELHKKPHQISLIVTRSLQPLQRTQRQQSGLAHFAQSFEPAFRWGPVFIGVEIPSDRRSKTFDPLRHLLILPDANSESRAFRVRQGRRKNRHTRFCRTGLGQRGAIHVTGRGRKFSSVSRPTTGRTGKA